MIVLLNGSFGIGKTTVARRLAERLPGAVVFNPELLGIPLQRAARLLGRNIEDFQDLRAWRYLTVAALRIVRMRRSTIIVPMAFSNLEYLAEVEAGVAQFEPVVRHVCLIAPIEVVRQRLLRRGADPVKQAWEFRRASECCTVHANAAFATQIDARGTVEEVLTGLLAAIDDGGKNAQP